MFSSSIPIVRKILKTPKAITKEFPTAVSSSMNSNWNNVLMSFKAMTVNCQLRSFHKPAYICYLWFSENLVVSTNCFQKICMII
jgi:hypothetical protein